MNFENWRKFKAEKRPEILAFSCALVATGVRALAGLSKPWVPGGRGQILTDWVIVSQPWGTDYSHHTTLPPPQVSDLPTALPCAFTFGRRRTLAPKLTDGWTNGHGMVVLPSVAESVQNKPLILDITYYPVR